MADATSTSNAINSKLQLMKQVKLHEVAIQELDSLSSSRAVYQKNANIFFRTTVPKAKASEQKHLDLAKSKIEKANAS